MYIIDTGNHFPITVNLFGVYTLLPNPVLTLMFMSFFAEPKFIQYQLKLVRDRKTVVFHLLHCW